MVNLFDCLHVSCAQWPEIAEDTTTRPAATNLSLQVTVTGLAAGQRFILCRYVHTSRTRAHTHSFYAFIH